MGETSKSDWIKWAICFGLGFACLLIPESSVITPQVKWFLVITVTSLAICAFELLHNMIVAALMPAFWILLGVAPTKTVLSSWCTSTTLMLIGALMMAAILEDCGVLRRIAYFLMCKVKGNYLVLLLSIFACGMLLNIVTSGRGYLVMAPLAAGLYISLGGHDTKLGVGLASAVMIGGCTSHSYTYQATAWAVINNAAGELIPMNTITPISIIVHCWPLMLISLLILWIISKWYKPMTDLSNITYFHEELGKMGSMSRREKVNLGMVIVLLVFIFTLNIHKIDMNIGFAIIPLLVFLPGLNGADIDTVKKFNWSMIFFMIACMSIGTVASSLGLGEAITVAIQNALGGSSSPFLLMGITFFIVFLLNFLMTPAAIFALITVPLITIATDLGYSIIPFLYAINACSEAIILPYEYIPYLIVFSFGMMNTIDFLKVNILRSIIFFAGFLGVLVPYWMLLGMF